MLLATVLVVGFIGMSSPSSIFAQYYDDDYELEYSQYYDNDYEKSYEKYMNVDYSKPSNQNIKINCDNSNRNPSDNNGDTSNAFEAPNGNSQSGQDRMNVDQKGNFKVICQNNNIKNIVNINNNDFNINNGTTINNISACNDEFSQVSSGNNGTSTGNNAIIGNFTSCNNSNFTFPSDPSQSSLDSNSGLTTASFDNEESSAQTQQIKLLQNNDGIKVQVQGDLPVDIQQIKSSNNDNGIKVQQQGTENSPKLTALEKQSDSHELTAMEKVTKLKTQWLSQLP